MSLRTTDGMAVVGHGTVTPVRKVHPVCSLSIKSTLIHLFLILLLILFILLLILPPPSLVLLVASFRHRSLLVWNLLFARSLGGAQVNGQLCCQSCSSSASAQVA